MAVLLKELRDKLERAVKDARDVAEPGARAALQQIAVDSPDHFAHMDSDARELRNRLRARAPQLGDRRDPRSGSHGIEHLVVECAYEHWHRMLFARFLAENNVLMHPDGVAVTLEECDELAEHEGAADGWDLASRYAARMLPQIFRPDAPVLQVRFPPEHQRKLEQILADLPAVTFTASDALGWVYQFWQAKKKDEVNKSEVKIGADELPAITQLFTEPYMVDFLLQNTLGAWWVGRHGRESLPVEMPYLRLLDDGTPAAGTFNGWPNTAAEITVLDPCCGSGHFLVAAFHILVRFRMADEGLSPADACDSVLRDNLHGLEIDERCTQIAAFALALAAWTLPEAGGYRALPEMHIACSGLAIRAKKEEWLALAPEEERVRNALELLFDLFGDSPTIGSLIDPATVGFDSRQGLLHIARFSEVKQSLDQLLASEERREDYRKVEIGVAAQGVATAAEILAAQYDLVCTNVPYLGRGDHDSTLASFCESAFPRSKADLSTCFLERCLRFASPHGNVATVLPWNWLFLVSYADLRKHVLDRNSLRLCIRLGERAFDSPQAAGAFACLVCLSKSEPEPDHVAHGLDVSALDGIQAKRDALRVNCLASRKQQEMRQAIDALVSFAPRDKRDLLGSYANCLQGTSTGDNPRYVRKFWELAPGHGDEWNRFQVAPSETTLVGGREHVVMWPEVLEAQGAAIRGNDAWGKRGVAVGQMRSLPATLYAGNLFANTTPAIVPYREENILPLWVYCKSGAFFEDLRRLNPKLSVDNGYIAKIPWDREHWREDAARQYPSGLPDLTSEEPTQWVFRGTLVSSSDPLQVAAARLLGYRWPEQGDDGLDDLIDADGIVCIPPVRGEESGAHRLQALLARAYGEQWSTQKREELLREVGCAGKGLDYWLRHKFFEHHAKLLHHRPFIWHIWDGLKRVGFAALVNYHKLDRKLLETLTYNYLGDWIKRQEDGVWGGVDGASERLAVAKELQKKLELILRGEPPYDIFVRWKPLHEQPIGWELDLNDGVRINIRPFMTAGVLRHSKPPKLNIKWTKDRGKDAEDAPWYHLFQGDRINDHHLTLEEKRSAREALHEGCERRA